MRKLADVDLEIVEVLRSIHLFLHPFSIGQLDFEFLHLFLQERDLAFEEAVAVGGVGTARLYLTALHVRQVLVGALGFAESAVDFARDLRLVRLVYKVVILQALAALVLEFEII